MKKILFIFALTLVNYANAQKDSYLVSGSIGFNTNNQSNDNNDKSNNIGYSINTMSGYQFNDHWTVGLNLNYSNNVNKSNSDSNNSNFINKSNSISAGPFLRYTKKITDLFSVYSNFGINYVYSKSKSESYLNEVLVSTGSGQSNGVSSYITPAIFINLKNNFGLNFGFGGIYYGFSSNKNQGNFNSKDSGFDFNLGQTFNIGLSKNF